jgi:recombinase-like zinc beta ribbon protein
VDAPHPRIVSDEIWQAVKNRFESGNATFSSRVGAGLCARSYAARYLFSGFLKCGLCGSNIVLISGRGGAGWAKYGCLLHQNRGVCANGLVIRRDRIEQELISGLQREVLREDVASFALEESNRQLRAHLDDTRPHLATMRNKREKLKSEIANLTRPLPKGTDRPRSLMNWGSARRNWTLSVKNSLRLTVAGSTHDSKRLRNSFRNACRISAACCLSTWPGPKLNSRNTARLLRSRRRDRVSELLGIGTCSADVRVVPGARHARYCHECRLGWRREASCIQNFPSFGRGFDSRRPLHKF